MNPRILNFKNQNKIASARVNIKALIFGQKLSEMAKVVRQAIEGRCKIIIMRICIDFHFSGNNAKDNLWHKCDYGNGTLI